MCVCACVRMFYLFLIHLDKLIYLFLFIDTGFVWFVGCIQDVNNIPSKLLIANINYFGQQNGFKAIENVFKIASWVIAEQPYFLHICLSKWTNPIFIYLFI